MLKSLLKVRLLSLWHSIVQTNGNKKYIKIVLAAVLVYAFGAMCFSFGMIFHQLCLPLYLSGLSWLYFAISAIFAFCLCLIGSVLAADAQLFEAKDNELLLSMPIPPRAVLLSRMSVILATNFLFVFVFAVPTGAVYAMQLPVTAGGVVIFLAAFLLLPFLVLPISCFFGWLIAFASTKTRHRSLFIFLFYLVLLVAYMVVYSSINSYIAKIVINGKPLADAVKSTLPPFYFFGKAISEIDFLNLLFYILCAVIPCILVIALISKNYYKIMMTTKRIARKEYVEKETKSLGAFAALTKKEITFFLSRPMYMMNAGIGLVLMVIFVVAAAVKGESILASMQLPSGLPFSFGTGVCIILCFCTSMTFISAPSVSLEGKNLWIPKSIPVKAEVILRSKIAAHLFICFPFIMLCGIVCAIAFGKSVSEVLLYFLLPLSATVFSAVLGVFGNMKFPKFDWINETVVIKQSAAVLVAMIGSFTAIILPLILVFYLGNKFSGMINLFLLLFCALLLILSYILYAMLMKNAEQKFRAL